MSQFHIFLFKLVYLFIWSPKYNQLKIFLGCFDNKKTYILGTTVRVLHENYYESIPLSF